MASPTNPRPDRYARRFGHDVWTFSGPPAYLESIQAAGTVAAPLLAGAGFTLVALVLQSSAPFGRWQDFALLLFVAAGLAQIFAVQSVIWTRRYMITPDELKQRFPDDFTDHGEQPTTWVQQYQRLNDASARRWAGRTRAWINAGITLLLAGVAVGVVPSGHISSARWSVIVVAWAGVAVEATWMTAMGADARARLALMMSSGAALAAGGATVAAGFAATAGAPGGAATWWAVALALATVPFWLAARTDAHLSYGRLRISVPFRGWRAIGMAVLAPVAPVVFILALWSVGDGLARSRRRALRARHPGVDALLPPGVSLGAHHRAWNQCSALPVSTANELAGLLAESGRVLGPGEQPELAGLWEKLVSSPRCVVQVVDRDDDRTRFGYYAAYPLLEETVARLRSGEVAADGQLGPGDLATRPADVAGWYIAVIWAPGSDWTRRCVIATLVDALAAATAGSAAQPVFARPATPAARSLMQRYGFAAVSAPVSDTWILEK